MRNTFKLLHYVFLSRLFLVIIIIIFFFLWNIFLISYWSLSKYYNGEIGLKRTIYRDRGV